LIIIWILPSDDTQKTNRSDSLSTKFKPRYLTEMLVFNAVKAGSIGALVQITLDDDTGRLEQDKLF